MTLVGKRTYLACSVIILLAAAQKFLGLAVPVEVWIGLFGVTIALLRSGIPPAAPAAGLALLLLSGCLAPDAGLPPVTVVLPGHAPRATNAAAVVWGLTAVDPAAYGGWSGACPGCDTDAAVFAMACSQEGVPAALLINEQATRARITAAAAAAAAALEPGGLLILFGSSHGTQRQDFSGDEPDGRDEAICLWDGPLLDDAVWDLLCIAGARGLRVWMITDCCHSGTNYRGAPASYGPGLAARAAGSGLQLLHWGGCGDGQYSYGSSQGGVFTSALVDAWRSGQSYAEWFAGASARMPANQVPTCEEVGPSFAGRPVFQ
jgi:hypothetical protein